MPDSAQLRGFVLLEILAVVTMLVLLATYAVPRFASLETEARSGSVEALAGRIRSAAALAHAAWLASGQPETVEVQAAPIRLVNGYPDRATINDAVRNSDDFSYDPGTGIFARDVGTAHCVVRYEEAASIGSVPVVAVDLTGC